jgi:hypothetical protein
MISASMMNAAASAALLTLLVLTEVAYLRQANRGKAKPPTSEPRRGPWQAAGSSTLRRYFLG